MKVFISSIVLLLLLVVFNYLGHNQRFIEAKDLMTQYQGRSEKLLKSSIKKILPLPKLVANTDNLVPEKKYKHWLVMSLQIDKKNWDDQESGIFTNPLMRGRAWEKPAHLSFVKNSKKIFSSPVGIRIHGDSSRYINHRKSLKIFFRDEYNSNYMNVLPFLTQVPGSRVERLVSRVNKSLYFSHDLFFDIRNKLGGLTPKIIPVVVYVNNKLFDFQLLSEHLDKRQLSNNFKDLHTFYEPNEKGKNDLTSQISHNSLLTKIKNLPAPIDMDFLAQKIDIDNLISHFIIVMYTGMKNWHEGILYKKTGDELSKWKLISWDYDDAINTQGIEILDLAVDNCWKLPSIEHLLRAKHTIAGVISSRLIEEENPKFKKLLFQKINMLFNNILTRDYIDRKLKLFHSYYIDAGSPETMKHSIEVLRKFIQKRKSFFCKQLNSYFGNSPLTCKKSMRDIE